MNKQVTFSAGAGTSTLNTRAGKRKGTTNPTPPKKARKTMGKFAGGVKINEPVLKSSTSTPPSGPQQKILIQR
jgi:hypothetical protein